MKVERRPVIYQPELAMPDQYVGVAERAVHVRRVGVEPDRGGRQRGLRFLYQRVEGDRTRQVVEREIKPRAGLDEVLNLGVRLRASEHRVKLYEDYLRHGQAQRAAYLARHQLRDERFRPLPGSSEL